jgi:hypothetical protein
MANFRATQDYENDVRTLVQGKNFEWEEELHDQTPELHIRDEYQQSQHKKPGCKSLG